MLAFDQGWQQPLAPAWLPQAPSPLGPLHSTGSLHSSGSLHHAGSLDLGVGAPLFGTSPSNAGGLDLTGQLCAPLPQQHSDLSQLLLAQPDCMQPTPAAAAGSPLLTPPGVLPGAAPWLQQPPAGVAGVGGAPAAVPPPASWRVFVPESLAAAPGGGGAAAAPHSQLLLQQQQQLAAAALLPSLGGTADAAAATSAAAVAAAMSVLASQQQQLAATLAANPALLPGLLGGSDQSALLQLLPSSQAAGGLGAAAGALLGGAQQPLAAQVLAAQLQQLGLASVPGVAAAYQPLGALPRAGSGSSAQLTRRAGGRGDRRRSSGCVSGDAATLLALPSLARGGGGAAADGLAGGGGAVDTAALLAAAGLTAKDVTPDSFKEFWQPSGGASDEATTTNVAALSGSVAASTATSLGSARWAGASSSSASSAASSEELAECRASLAGSVASAASGGAAGAAGDAWQWDSHFCSLDDEEVAVKGASASGVAGRAQRRGAAAGCADDAVRAAGRDQAPAAGADDTKRLGAAAPSAAAGEPRVAGCAVWFPGAREASRADDYLPLPPTCRLFVGNIGSWVDEASLLAYFERYGRVVDVQVMWNTKMLSRGRRVNREFAFISYSEPREAARAVHWLDGCRLPDLQKDGNGITVEYENGDGDTTSGSGNAVRPPLVAAK